MQETITEQYEQKDVIFSELSSEDRLKLVNVFVWLIEEDKKQNPAIYQVKRNRND